MHSARNLSSDMSYQDSLKNILTFAQSMHSKSVMKLPSADNPFIPLPALQPVSTSTPSAAARAFSTVFAHSVLEIRAAHESALGHRRACSSVRLSSQLRDVGSFLEKKYHEQLRIAEQHCSANRAKHRPVFNQVCPPKNLLCNNGLAYALQLNLPRSLFPCWKSISNTTRILPLQTVLPSPENL
jgi:hypothetical protein